MASSTPDGSGAAPLSPQPSSPEHPQPPSVPDHELLHLIGRGSYGEVWLARNVMGTLRAVKVVYRRAFEHDRPFDREFSGLRRYEPISRSHDGLVQILQAGRNEQADCFYYVMELADAASFEGSALNSTPTPGSGAGTNMVGSGSYRPRTLAGDLRRKGALSLEQCLSLAAALGSALDHLHQQGLVHRDLKPSNIIFVNGRPKIADIGLVAESGDSRSLVGTEGFFPPQGPGLPQADLYALGKVLYEVSTGMDRLQFPQIPAEWVNTPAPSEFLEFNEILIKACHNDPARRYQNAQELLADVALLRIGESVRHFRRLEKRLRAARRAGVLAAALAVLAAAGYGLANRQASVERESRRQVERAQLETRRQLAEARLAQARALRRTGEAGQRFDCLEVVAAAARSQPTLELRNEAIGALALVDFRVKRRLPLQGISYAEPAIDLQGSRYVCGDAKGNLGLRRASDDKELFQLPGEGHRVDWIPGFGPNGRFLAVRPAYNRLAVWDLEKREKVLEVPAQQGQVYAQFLSGGGGIVWNAGPRLLRFCELPSGLIKTEWSPREPLWRFACEGSGKHIAVAYRDTNLVEILNMETGAVVARMPQPAFVQGICWHPSRPLLATACHDRNIHLWDPLTGIELLALEGHQETAASLDFHPTLDILASSSWDGTTRLWDLQTGRQLAVLQEAGDNLQFSADGRWLTLDEYSDAHVLLCELATDTVCRTIPWRGSPTNQDVMFESIACDPRGRWLVGTLSSGVQILDLSSGGLLASLDLGRVHSAWFDAKESLLTTAGEAGLLRHSLATLTDGRLEVGETRVLGQPGQSVGFACESPGRLAWIEGNGVHVLTNGLEEAQLEAGPYLDHLAMSPDGRWLAASRRGPFEVRVWETARWKQVGLIPTSGRVRLAFSPDRASLLVGGGDDYLFWDVAGARPEPRLGRFHTSTGYGKMAFSPDGRLLAVARSRTMIALYEYPTLRELACFEAPSAPGLSFIAFDSTGDRLLVSSAMNQVQVWDLVMMRRQLTELGLNW